MNNNYMLKVQDAKMTDIQKALQAAGIKITSIIEVYKENAGGVAETKTSET